MVEPGEQKDWWLCRDRRDVAHEIEFQIRVERRVHRIGRNRHEDRVTVRRGPYNVFGGGVAAEARRVLDQEWLAEPLRQPLAREATDDVGSTAGWKRDDQIDRTGWITLRPCNLRQGRQRGSDRGQMKKISAGKFHSEPPFTSLDHLVGAGEQRWRNFEA